MVEIHTYPEMNAKIKDLLRIGEQPICIYAAKRVEELEEYERKKGKWKLNAPDDFIVYCSECIMPQDSPCNFCPSCGADMRGET